MNDYNKNIYDSTDAEIDDGSMITDVKSNGKDFTVGNIINLWNDGELKIPEFQRRYVWKIEQASKFIESLMLGLPIPSLMVYEDKDSYLLVIDGQQRIKSILLFVGAINTDTASKHSKHEKSLCNFKLKGLADDSIYKNKSYNDFTEKEKRIFKNKCSLYINLISLTNPDNLTSVYHIFERLNTGGTLLTAQEIRNCIFAGPFNDFIIRLNDYSNWKKFSADFKAVYHAPTESAALSELESVKERWGKKYPYAISNWENNWEDVSSFFQFSDDIRRIMYTTNIIEGVNRQYRKVTKTKSVFPSDTSLEKMLYLASENVMKKWTQRYRSWDQVLNQLIVLYGERITDYL